MFSIGSKFALISNGKNYLSAKSGIKDYVIGFSNHKDAYMIQRSLCKTPDISIRRTNFIDIAHEVKLNLMALNIPIEDAADEITIDPDAKIEFKKAHLYDYDVLSGYESDIDYDLDYNIDYDIDDDVDPEDGSNDGSNDGSDDKLHITYIDSSEFLMYPFEKNIGIIIPYDLYYEDNNRYIYTANLIDSSSSTKMFIKSFNKKFLN
jgi:hypothetical protein